MKRYLFVFIIFFSIICITCGLLFEKKHEQAYDFCSHYENLEIKIWKEDNTANDQWQGICVFCDLFYKGQKIHTYEFEIDASWGFPVIDGWRKKSLITSFDGMELKLQQEILTVILDLQTEEILINRDYMSCHPISTLCNSKTGRYSVRTYGYTDSLNVDYVLTDHDLKKHTYLKSSVFELLYYNFVFLDDDNLLAYNQHECWLLNEKDEWAWVLIEGMENSNWTITDVQIKESNFYLSIFEEIDAQQMDSWPYPEPAPAIIRVYNNKGMIEEAIETNTIPQRVSKSEFKEEIVFVDNYPVLDVKDEYRNLAEGIVPYWQSKNYDYLFHYERFTVGIWGKQLLRQGQFSGIHLYFDFYPGDYRAPKRYNFQVKSATADDILLSLNEKNAVISFDGKEVSIQGETNVLILDLEKEKFTISKIGK